jgi:DNA-binding transcriptional LysR family regulator
MRPLIRRVPQLHRLAVFNAVASAGDFTSAARDLQISQPAVSRHMAALARELDIDLFERSGRSLVLTSAGRTLAEAVESTFSSLERVLSELDDQPEAFVFAVQPAMATSWVVPLLDQLESAAGVELRLRIFERSAELDSSDWDLAIVPGTGTWAGWESTMLFREAVRPFASPSLAAELGLGPETAPLDLAGHNLLHIDDVGRPNMTWKEWFAEAGEPLTPAKPRLVYNSYPTVIQEALAGNGIALGWQHLLSDMVERGLLVPVGPVVQRRHGGHHVCWRIGRADERHRAILDRLQADMAGSSASFTQTQL